MPTTSGPSRRESDDDLDVPSGTQALVLTPSLRSPLSAVPPAAFENTLVVSNTRPPRKVEQLVRDRGGDPNAVGLVPVSGSPVDYDGPLWTTSVVHPNDLSGIYERFDRGMNHVKPGEGWVVFDNVNVLLMYAERSGVENLLESVASNVRRRNAAGAYALVRDAVTDETYADIASVFDVERDFSDDGH
ncbi:hypothetical protein [Halorubellus sp. PRR65]|uniref:DUF7504 family protein n=1 Tax=Halorubellus sp. PRR65 TaxID=3098148 RepID=UPI002B262A68|nr:hypothetical protein [Halorubellus sp. PRR65]